VKRYRNSSSLRIVSQTDVSTIHKQMTKSPQIHRNAKSVIRKKPLGLRCECV